MSFKLPTAVATALGMAALTAAPNTALAQSKSDAFKGIESVDVNYRDSIPKQFQNPYRVPGSEWHCAIDGKQMNFINKDHISFLYQELADRLIYARTPLNPDGTPKLKEARVTTSMNDQWTGLKDGKVVEVPDDGVEGIQETITFMKAGCIMMLADVAPGIANGLATNPLKPGFIRDSGEIKVAPNTPAANLYYSRIRVYAIPAPASEPK